jgi:hypothetical protein
MVGWRDFTRRAVAWPKAGATRLCGAEPRALRFFIRP